MLQDSWGNKSVYICFLEKRNKELEEENVELKKIIERLKKEALGSQHVEEDSNKLKKWFVPFRYV